MWSCLTIHSVKIELIKTTVVYMPLENSDSVFLYRGPCFGLLLRESCSIAKIILKPLNLLIKLPVVEKQYTVKNTAQIVSERRVLSVETSALLNSQTRLQTKVGFKIIVRLSI